MNIDKLLDELTLEEKVSLLAGHDFWTTVPIERLNIPQIKVTDGPNGARGDSFSGTTAAVCYPCGTALAATWDTALVSEVGRSLGLQVKSKGAHVLLAPTVNMHRTPLAGRNFECYSEDPYLSSRMAVAYISGLQSEGVGACIKHFIANDQEFERNAISSEVDERTLHEIYLPPFRAAVKEAQPWAVMSSYNKLNGTYCSEDKALLIDLLKDKWGFDGVVISDWFGSYSNRAAAGGLDLEMPGKARFLGDNVRKMVEDGELAVAVVDDKVRRLLRMIEKADVSGPLQPETVLNGAAEQELVRRAGAESIVLLKNRDGLLPLAEPEKIAVIGANALRPQVNGGGSAQVAAPYVVSPLDAIRGVSSAEIQYVQGCTIHKRLPVIEDVEFDISYFNDPAGEAVHRDTRSNAQFTWFGDIPDGVGEGFTLRLEGTLTAFESGKHQFSVAGVGTARLKIGTAQQLDHDVDASSVGSPFEMWDHEQVIAVELTAGEQVAISAEYTAPTSSLFRALRLGHLPPQPADPIADAVAAAAEAEVAVIVAGINEEWESEGFDRESMDLPGRQNELITRVAAANPNTIVVLNVGAPVHMPWINDVAAVLQSWLLGQEQGNAIADVLFGMVNPSAKLPTTFPVRNQDNPAYLNFPGENGQVRYGEGLFVGYRYYDKKQIAPLFPFGYGLSYTTFDYANLRIEPAGADFSVSFDVTNAGKRDGREVVQLYVRDVESSLMRPEKELKAFGKVALVAGETQTVTLLLKREELAFYNPVVREWVIEAGEFVVMVGGNSAEIALTASITIAEEVDTARLSIDTAVIDLLEDADGRSLLEQMMPDLLTHPMFDMVKTMALPQIAKLAPGQLSAEILAKLDQALRRL